MKKSHLLCAVCTLFLSVPSYAATIIDTTTSWDGSSSIDPFGEGNTATYGQTFTVIGSDTQLDSFSFFLNDFSDVDFVDFQAYVMEWDGFKATGPILFQSSSMSTTNNGGSGGFEQIIVTTGGLNLITGTKYVTFFNASNQFDGIKSTASWGVIRNSTAYADGEFVYDNNGNDFSLLTSYTWDNTSSYYDAVFTMSLSSPVPIPAAVWLFGSGLLGLIGMARRNKAA